MLGEGTYRVTPVDDEGKPGWLEVYEVSKAPPDDDTARLNALRNTRRVIHANDIVRVRRASDTTVWLDFEGTQVQQRMNVYGDYDYWAELLGTDRVVAGSVRAPSWLTESREERRERLAEELSAPSEAVADPVDSWVKWYEGADRHDFTDDPTGGAISFIMGLGFALQRPEHARAIARAEAVKIGQEDLDEPPYSEDFAGISSALIRD
jgi:hypothetical protein